jgi:hypothetical protein
VPGPRLAAAPGLVEQGQPPAGPLRTQLFAAKTIARSKADKHLQRLLKVASSRVYRSIVSQPSGSERVGSPVRRITTHAVEVDFRPAR